MTVLRFLPPGGATRAYEFHGDPGLVRLDPRWHQAAWRFVKEGFFHILDGTDHLLFLLCLVIPFRRFRALIPIVTSFTVAHSITLIASAYDAGPESLWFPPLIETLIAISIVYMALENISPACSNAQRRWMIAFGFGLVHGFGFSFALRQTLAIRRVSPADVAAFVQRRRRARPTPCADTAHSHAGDPLPLRGRRAHGDDHPLGVGGPHRLALDDRARGPAAPVPVSVAGAHRRPAGKRSCAG